ncbi:MAG TPA: response regulator transcription factor, partial [Bryobacteraceae bacterium]|nr:response regulator transcription factor [Bryobacteraceae bacterium]
MMPRKTRIFLADDHAVVRKGFRLILDQEPDLEVIGEAGDGQQAVDLACALRPDVLIIDIGMPNVNGVEATRRILENCPESRILILSMHKDPVYVRESLRAGARGYLLKDA